MAEREDEKAELILEMIVFTGLVIYVSHLYESVGGNRCMGAVLGFSSGIYFYMPLRLGDYFGLKWFESIFLTFIFLVLVILLDAVMKGSLLLLFLIPVTDIWYNVFRMTIKK